MDLEKIEKLALLMAKHNLSELELAEGERRICLKHGSAAPAVYHAAAPAAAAPTAPAAVDDGSLVFKSELVGTFYRAPSPGSKNYIEIGDSFVGTTTLCIIEAMKVMNEIKPEVSGVLTEILVENGAPVQYGQPLFRYKPA